MTDVSQQVSDSWLNEGPGSLVLGLFLYPLNLCVLVTIEGRFKVAEGEGSHLFYSHNGDIIDVTLLSLIDQIVVNLTTAEENFLDLVISDQILCCLFDDTLETKTCLELFNVGVSTSKLEQFLGDGDNQGLAERSSDLSSEQVEELSGCGALSQSKVHLLRNLSLRHVVGRVLIVSIIELQESLDTR